MKKVFYLLLTVITLQSNAQIDTTGTAERIATGLTTTILFPADDAGGGQERPCGTVITSSGPCCHLYEVVCNGVVQWSSATFCDQVCLLGLGAIFWGNVNGKAFLPTVSNPRQIKIDFDMSVITKEIPVSIQEIIDIKKDYKEFNFQVKEDIIVKNPSSVVIYKKGYYTIKNGKMDLNYYFTK